MSAVMAFGAWRNNAEMIADVAKLGYLEGEVADVTYGLGRFWKVWRPDDLVACDIDPSKSPLGVGVNFTRLPFKDGRFGAVVLDPPYKLNGTASGRSDSDYGVDTWKSSAGRHGLVVDGMGEAKRVLRIGGHLLVKCQDQVNGGKKRWQTIEFANHGQTVLGMPLVDQFHLQSYRPQPNGTTQQHSRGNYSTLLVFRKVAS